MVKRASDRAWLNTHLSKLLEMTSQIRKIEKDIFYEAKILSPLKLISLMLYLNFYTKLAPRTCKLYYIDLLADSGINKVEKDFVAGSPVIAHLFAHRPFEKLLLCENNNKSSKALKLRLSKVDANFELFEGDCNENIDSIIDYFKSKTNYLAFIDYEGFEVAWSTVEKLLKFPYGDLIFTFQTQEVRRVWGNWKKAKNEMFEAPLNKIYGDDRWKIANNQKDLLNIFINRIREYRANVKDIDVKTRRRGLDFHYNLIFATRETSGGTPWFENVIGNLKRRVENNPGEYVRNALAVLTGRIKNLEKFIE